MCHMLSRRDVDKAKQILESKHFLELLYDAYRDDIQHLITMTEFILMMRWDLRECLQFLQSTNVKFPAIGTFFNGQCSFHCISLQFKIRYDLSFL